MKIVMAFTLASSILLGTVMAPTTSGEIKKTEKYTCVFDDSNPFPDGTDGVAELSVKRTGKGNTFVSVEYYSENYQDYLGIYQEGNGNFVPSTKEEACQFAFDHFGDRE